MTQNNVYYCRESFGLELPRLHVIQYEAVEHHDFISLSSPEVIASSLLSR